MGIGPMHLFVLAAIALLFFGPSKLPALGKSMGEAIKGFKDAMNDVNNEAEGISRSVQAPPPQPKMQAAPPPQQVVPRETAHEITTEVGRELATENVSHETKDESKPKTPIS